MTSRLLRHFKQKIESFEMIPSSGGCFELTVGDELVYSKLSTGAFPDEQQMVDAVASRL